jgi:hypothetical protein
MARLAIPQTYRPAVQRRAVANAAARKQRLNPAQIAWSPHPENKPQQMAYASKADRLFFGGRAGGGKSDLLLGTALTAHHSAIIYRREYPQLKEIIRRSREIVGGLGRYNSTEKLWSELPFGRVLEFGAVQYEADVEKFQGRAHSLKGYDEICHFTQAQFEYLCGWNRSAFPGERSRIIATGNPPTTSTGLWVIEYWGPWLDEQNELYGKVQPGELVWYYRHPDTDEDRIIQVGGDRPDPVVLKDKDGIRQVLKPHSRTFIPASLSDNPYLSGTDYVSVLQAMPKKIRDSLLHGIFTVSFEDDPWQIVPSEWVELAFQRWETATPGPLQALGVDVARGGADETILAPLYGKNYFGQLVAYPGEATPNGPKVAAQIMEHVVPGVRVNIDVVGVGSSVYDNCEAACDAYAISAGTRSEAADATGNVGFFNLRTEMLWKIREALDPALGINLALPRDTKLKADLCATCYEYRAPTEKQQERGLVGQYKAESKDQVKDRLGRSPDRGDAVSYAYHKAYVAKFKAARASWG